MSYVNYGSSIFANLDSLDSFALNYKGFEYNSKFTSWDVISSINDKLNVSLLNASTVTALSINSSTADFSSLNTLFINSSVANISILSAFDVNISYLAVSTIKLSYVNAELINSISSFQHLIILCMYLLLLSNF